MASKASCILHNTETSMQGNMIDFYQGYEVSEVNGSRTEDLLRTEDLTY